MFLNHWLVAQTSEEVVAREVFSKFKSYSSEAHSGMESLLGKLDRAASGYRKFIESGSFANSQLNRLQLFAYRTGVLESEVVKPLVLFVYDPEKSAIPPTQIEKALAVVESWMVRRMLVRATTKSYTQLMAEIIRHLQDDERRLVAGDSIESFLASQTSDIATGLMTRRFATRCDIFRPTDDCNAGDCAWFSKPLKTTCEAGSTAKKVKAASRLRKQNFILNM